jgi:hypothetical protein
MSDRRIHALGDKQGMLASRRQLPGPEEAPDEPPEQRTYSDDHSQAQRRDR